MIVLIEVDGTVMVKIGEDIDGTPIRIRVPDLNLPAGQGRAWSATDHGHPHTTPITALNTTTAIQ